MRARKRSTLERFLRLFTDVRAGEGVTAMLLAVNLFILLSGYYLLKTIREPLILGTEGGGAEVKSYASALQALLLIGVSVGFGRLAARVARLPLIAIVSGFFISNLIAFYLLHQALPSHRLAIGVAFFVWVGCFNVMVIAQFWAFANDLYSRGEGERLFPVVAGGSALGAVAGARFAKPLFLHYGAYTLMLLAAAMIAVCLLFTWLTHQREHGRRPEVRDSEPVGPAGGFQLLVRDRYLQLVAALSLIKNWVNTTGEYILDRRLLEAAHLRVGTDSVAVGKFIGAFKSDYFTYVNAIALGLQLAAVSRIIRYLGVRRALYILPLVALTGYGAMAFVPILGVIFAGKIAENSLDYSVQKTVEQTLFLSTSREAKYKVKAIVDTALVRFGDVLSAGVVWVGSALALSTFGFIVVNVALVMVWLLVVTRLARDPATAPVDSGRPRVKIGRLRDPAVDKTPAGSYVSS